MAALAPPGVQRRRGLLLPTRTDIIHPWVEEARPAGPESRRIKMIAPLESSKRWKLPQARLYLNAAKWGIDELVNRKHMGHPFRFFVIGILASLRPVQHALYNHDRHISAEHRKAIDEWWDDSKNMVNAPELSFIKTARDQILKRGRFDAYATFSESGTGEGSNYMVTDEQYDLAYYFEENRGDLNEAIRKAIAWATGNLRVLK
jgi:hypothetical protein